MGSVNMGQNLAHLSEGHLQCLLQVVADFLEVSTSKFGLTHLLGYQIHLRDMGLVRLPPCRLSLLKIQILCKHIKQL
jgi:hypothetical protein